MKPGARKAGIVALAGLGSLLFIALVTWSAGFLYWHFQITSALKELDAGIVDYKDYDPSARHQLPLNPVNFLRDAGCRAAPYLLQNLEPGRKRAFLHHCADLLIDVANRNDSDQPLPQEQEDAQDERRASWLIGPTTSPEEIRTRCAQIRSWWREHEGEHHRFWRWWTANCRSE